MTRWRMTSLISARDKPLPGRVLLRAALYGMIIVLAGCITAPEVDWRLRRAVVDMERSAQPGIIGTLAVAGTVYASTFTDGAMWIVIASPTKRGLPVNRLARIDLASNRLTDILAVGGYSHAALVADGESLWLADGLGGDRVSRIDLATHQLTASIALPRNPVAIAASTGSIWVLAAARANKLGRLLLSVSGLALYRIDPASHRIVGITAIPGEGETADLPTNGRLTVTPGAIWVTTRSGKVHRIDPRSGDRRETFATGAEAGDAYAASTNDKLGLIEQVSARLGQAAYDATAAEGSLWAFSHPAGPSGALRGITVITRLQP